MSLVVCQPVEHKLANSEENMSTKNWFVTGISRGFGRTLCQELLQRGHHVVGQPGTVHPL